MVTAQSSIIWILIPGINFCVWYKIATKYAPQLPCVVGNKNVISPFLRSDTTITGPAVPLCEDYTDCGPLMSDDWKNFGPPTPPSQGYVPLDGVIPPLDGQIPAFASAKVSQFTPHLEYLNTSIFERYRMDHLAAMNFKAGVLRFYDPITSYSVMVRRYPNEECTSMYHQYVNLRNPINTCLAVVRIKDIVGALPGLRFEKDIDENGLSYTLPGAVKRRMEDRSVEFVGNEHNQENRRPSGHFRAVPGQKGRERTDEKMMPFLEHFDGPTGIEQQLKDKLAEHGIGKGHDLIVMVVNEGEIDLFLNFACSCRANKLSMKSVFVFSASPEIITIIESTGAIGIYHEGYSSVSKKASNDYLDRVFVDMMWYKAFAIFLILRMDINVLFQDVDLVWFRDPFPYFHDFMEKSKERAKQTGSVVEAFFSDDGQRSLRYAPFYANSGFYYLLANERTTHFAWSIMISFDIVQVLGSHQNVFTIKLIEGIALSASKSKLLALSEFPTGILYHHDKDYMKRMADHEVHPFNYHMCWTQGKPEKLIYLRNVKMWYLTETCSNHENLKPDGEIFGKALTKVDHDHDTNVRWDHLSELCCTVMEGAPY